MFFSRSDETNSYRPLLGFLLLTLVVGALASVVTEPSIADWYARLLKPSFNPPNWLFAPVWTALYILMAIAAWRVWRSGQPSRTGQRGPISIEIVLFLVQLAFNGAWSFIFFYAHRIAAALVELGVLWLLIAATLVLFWRRDRIAGILLLPYLAWTGFAFVLNLAIWQLNR
ncbi:MAG TPA: TspO/MBR family protein [Rhizomicrobium sp.]|jgi:tryptophan-rich sensory protein|nr:TspO/MBR family protein [Rhizomicrobium sp.]